VKPERHGGEIERAEPDTELHCSPVLRSDVVPTVKRGVAGVGLARSARPMTALTLFYIE
jgi:hypothetical protein